ncbi:hypothetical protein O9929_14480 [Vibrio lentus]|nr:hypothetical protein [Vibrio lentus]
MLDRQVVPLVRPYRRMLGWVSTCIGGSAVSLRLPVYEANIGSLLYLFRRWEADFLMLTRKL